MPASKYFGFLNALDFAFGQSSTIPALVIQTGNGTTGSSTITLEFATCVTPDGRVFTPMNVNNPVLVGDGTDQETVTPTGVSQATPAIYGSPSFSGSFLNLHGMGETVATSTYGLQEAINFAAAAGGGIVCVDSAWAAMGGTTAMLAAAILPSSGSVIIEDHRGLGVQWWANRPTSATAYSAPSAPVAANAGVLSVAGTYTSGNVGITYTGVTAAGGETVLSSSFTLATGAANTAIGGTGMPATTGFVGYRVYLTTVGGSTPYLLPVIAANCATGAAGIIQCGPLAAFAVGTSWQSLAPRTSADALQPAISTAFETVLSQPSATLPQVFQTTWPSFGNVGAISAGAATTMGQVQLPTGFLNYFGRTIRIKGLVAITVNSATGLITLNVNLHSLFGTTKITPFTTATPSAATGGTQVINLLFETVWTTSKVGTTGTLEAHGSMIFNAAGTLVSTVAQDDIDAASSTIDLTKQDCLEVSVTTTTIAPTAGTLRQLSVEVMD
jgi:hypothetical protein